MNKINGQADTKARFPKKAAKPKIRTGGQKIMLDSEIIEITPAMLAAGEAAVGDVGEACSAYLAEVAYLAMESARRLENASKNPVD